MLTDKDITTLIQSVLGAGLLGVLGRFGLKLMSRRRDQFDEGSKIREELRKDIAMLRTGQEEMRKELDELREEVDGWRDRYYKLLGEYVDLNAKCKSLESELHRLHPLARPT